MTSINVVSLKKEQKRIIEGLVKEALEIISNENALNEYFFDDSTIEVRNGDNKKNTTRRLEIVSRTLNRIKKELSIETLQGFVDIISNEVFLQVQKEELEQLNKPCYQYMTQKKTKKKNPDATLKEIENESKRKIEKEAKDEAEKKSKIAHTTLSRWISGERPIGKEKYLDVISSLYVDGVNNNLLNCREKSIFFQEFIKFYIEENYQKMCLDNCESENVDDMYCEVSIEYIEIIESKILKVETEEQKKIAVDMIHYLKKYL